MISCRQCHVDLPEDARFCPQCGEALSAASPVDPVRVEINRNRLYKRDHSGLLEFRVTNRHEAEITAVLRLESAMADLLSSVREGQVRLTPGASGVSRIPIDPKRSGEFLFTLRVTCRTAKSTRRYAADDMVLRVVESGGAQNVAITIDNSLSAGGDMSAISNRAQSELGRQLIDLARAGAGMNDSLESHSPDRWELIALLVEESGLGDLDAVLGLTPSAEEQFRRAAWDALADGKLSNAERRRLEALVEEHGIGIDRAQAILAEVKDESLRAHERLRREAEQADRIAHSDRELRSYLEKRALQSASDWKRWVELGWPEAEWLLGECYRLKIQEPTDKSEAERLIQRAADAGLAAAMSSVKRLKNARRSSADRASKPRPAPRRIPARSPAASTPTTRPSTASTARGANPPAAVPPQKVNPTPASGYTAGAQSDQAAGYVAASSSELADQFVGGILSARPATPAPPSPPSESADEYERYEKLTKLLNLPAKGSFDQQMKFNMGFSDNADDQRLWVSRVLALNETVAEACLHPMSMFELAKGIERFHKDTALAQKWYRKAGYRGHVGAMITLGNQCSNEGQNVKNPDGFNAYYIEALFWYRKAAEAGDAVGMTSLGWMTALGFGTSKSADEAARWFRKAADLGNTEAMIALATLCEMGRGVPKSLDEARKWLSLAAQKDTNFFATRKRVNDDLKLFLG